GAPLTVSLEHALLAIRWCEYLESHARRVYSIFSTEMYAAQKLVSKIKERVFAEANFFTCREVQQKCWSCLKTTEEIRMALKVLQEAGWVRRVGGKSGPDGGRPSERYEVNPRIWSLQSGEDE